MPYFTIRKPQDIVGSLEWGLKKDKRRTGKSISFSGIKKMKLEKEYHDNDGEEDLHKKSLNSGWEFDEGTKTWTHFKYGKKQKFPSIYQFLPTGERVTLPYSNGSNDPYGLTYGYINRVAGNCRELVSNEWLNEEFDTRSGRRREHYREKKRVRGGLKSFNFGSDSGSDSDSD